MDRGLGKANHEGSLRGSWMAESKNYGCEVSVREALKKTAFALLLPHNS